MNEYRIGLLVEARNQASRVLREVSGALAEMERSVRSGSLGRGLRETSEGLSSLVRAAGPLLTGLGGAFAGWQLGRTTLELGRMGAQAERVKISFRSLYGEMGSTRALEAMRAASRGTVADSEMMLAANRASLLGVTQSAEELAKLMEVARVRGRAMGLTMQQAFNDMVTGIGRGSAMILDNLGLIVDLDEAYQKHARTLGITTEALSEQQKTRALLNAVLEDSERYLADQSLAALDAVDKIGQIQAAWQNLKEATGELIVGPEVEGGGTLVTNLLDDVTRIVKLQADLDDFNVMLKRQRDAGLLSAGAFRTLSREAAQLNNAAVLGREEMGRYNLRMAVLRQRALEGANALGEVRFESMLWSEALAGLGPHAALAASRIRGLTASTQSYGSAVWGAIAAVRQFRNERAGAIGRWAQEGQHGIPIGFRPEDIEAAEQAQWRYNYTLADTSGKLDMLRQKLSGVREGSEEYYDILTQIASLEKSRAGGGGGGGTAIRQEAQELRSMIEEVLRPTQVTELDWAATNLGRYTDKWDEYVRRLRSAATDAESQWRHLIPTDVLAQGQDAIRLYVAEQERLVQHGLWEQIESPHFDAGAAMDAIFLGLGRKAEEHAGREALIARIMGDPRATTLGLSRSDVARMVGAEGPTGAAIADEVRGAFESSSLATDIGEAFARQVEANDGAWRRAGAYAVGVFEEGFRSGLSPQLGRDMADWLTPYVATALEDRVAP